MWSAARLPWATHWARRAVAWFRQCSMNSSAVRSGAGCCACVSAAAWASPPLSSGFEGDIRMSGFVYERDTDGIVTIIMDMANSSANTMNPEFARLMRESMQRLEQEQDLKGVVLASAKKTFF